MDPISLYITLLLAGFVLIGSEIFIPGGILGIFGSLAWVAAAVVGWREFPEPWNVLSVLALLVAGIVTFVVWVKYFPKSRIGKTLSLSSSAKDFKSNTTDDDVPVGTVGEVICTLRPSGIALFDGHRLDVVADGEWIEAGEAVKISSTSGGHIAVVKA